MDIRRSKARLTEHDIAQLEQRLGLTIPQDLRKFYLDANGGAIQPDSFEKDGEFYTVQYILPIVGPKDGLEASYATLLEDGILSPDLIPFADDPNGDYFVYSVSSDTFGEVQFLQTEYYNDPERLIIPLASSLKEFLDALVVLPQA